ncbi:MAG TPA: hypothetical protein VGM29_12630, partial [Polyangiaceae bacterium]
MLRACAFAIACTLTARARAESGPLPFQVHSAGSAECDASSSFAARLEQRSRRLRPALASEPAIDFSLELGSTGRALSGRLRVRERDGNETERVVTGASCDEVLSALALIAAVLVDPNALSERAQTQPAAQPEPAVARSEPPAGAPPKRSWAFGAGVGAGVEGAIAPDVAFTSSAQLEAALGGDGILSPRVALAVHQSFPDTVTTPAGLAHFRWTALRVSGCPLRYPSSGPWALRPCLLFDAGRLEVAGDRTYLQDTARVTWFALGGVAHAELRPIPPLSFGLDAGFVAPFVRDTFFFAPGGGAETLNVPKIGLTLRLGFAAY